MTDRLRYPDFYCIGVEKAGTTWLHRNLQSHPRIYVPPVKEIAYFNEIHVEEHVGYPQKHRTRRARELLIGYLKSHENPNFDWVQYLAKCGKPLQSDADYAHFFSWARPEQVCGEFTPVYCILPEEGIEHLMRLNRDAKIIILLRHPASRDLSHAKMLLRQSGEMGSSDPTQVVREFLNYRWMHGRSDYPAMLARWEKHAGSGNVLVDFFDRIKTDPLAVIENVCRFLEVDFRPELFPSVKERVNAAGAIDVDDEALIAEMSRRYVEVTEYVNSRFGASHSISW